MKKRILSFILAFIVVAGVIVTPLTTFAASDNVDYLLEEIQTNIPDFDPGKYPKNEKGSPMIIGSTFYDVYESYIPGSGYDGTIFSLYVYNPTGKAISYARGCFELNAYSEHNSFKFNNGENEVLFYKDDYSRDGLFYKLSYKLDIPDREPLAHTLNFNVYYLELEYSSGTEYYLDQHHVSRFEPASAGSYNVTLNATGRKELDVNITSYKVGTVGTDLTTRYEIFSAYFSIPEQYYNYYNQLYSITSEYVKKQTVPIIWSSDPMSAIYFYNAPVSGPSFALPSKKLGFISSDYTITDNGFGQILTLDSNTVINLPTNQLQNVHFYNDFGAPFVLGIVSDSDPSYEYLKDYLSTYSQADSDKLIYAGYEQVINTKTIDQTFDILDYYDSASWLNYWKDFGATTGFLRWAYDNTDFLSYRLSSLLPVAGILGAFTPEKLQTVLSGFCDFEASREHIEDSPYLVLLNDEDRSFIASRSDIEISEKYLVSLDDVPAFKQYVYNNPFTVLYRYDICESYSDELVKFVDYKIDYIDLDFTSPVDKYPLRDLTISDEYTYGISQRFDFFDFEVVNITFELDDQYVSVCTRSTSKNYTPGLTVDPGEDAPPVNLENGFNGVQNWADDFKNDIENKVDNFLKDASEKLGEVTASITEFLGTGLFGFLDGFGKGLMGSSWNIFKPILIILGVIILIFVVWWIVKSINGSNIFDVATKTAEIKIKRSEADTRRRDSEADARIRAEQNAIRKRELTIDEDEKKRRSENRSRTISIRERDQARRYAKEDAAEKARVKEERRQKREAKKAEKESKKAKYNNIATEDYLLGAFKRTYGDDFKF